MDAYNHRPELIIIAGPNGSGKTSITQKFLHHDWAEGTTYINPDQVAKDMFGYWNNSEAVLKATNYCASPMATAHIGNWMRCIRIFS